MEIVARTESFRYKSFRYTPKSVRYKDEVDSIHYPSRFDTKGCVCFKLKQKPQIQNQRFHNRIIYPQRAVCVMK